MKKALQLWFNGFDFVFAYTWEQARELVVNQHGCDRDEAGGLSEWEAWEPNRPFRLRVEVMGWRWSWSWRRLWWPFVREMREEFVTKPAREWVREQRGEVGYFASTEY